MERSDGAMFAASVKDQRMMDPVVPVKMHQEIKK
jgi:hypothetical protein